MDFNLITEYPWWFMVICVAFGLLVTYILYFLKDRNDFSRPVTWLLAILRFISVTLLAFLLISPMVRTTSRTTVKPAVIIGIDNSSSIVMNADSSFYRNEFINSMQSLAEDLKDDYEVHTYTFGDYVEIDSPPLFDAEVTEISALFDEVNTRYYNRNIGAVILASDGIYNSGADPLHQVRNSSYPVFTVKMGDTTSRKDLKIQKVSHNKTAFKGNRFPVDITIQAIGLPGKRSVVRVFDKDNQIFSQDISVTSHNQVMSVPVYPEADVIGLKRLRIVVDKVEDEANTGNNEREIFVEIRESKLKVAIIANAPHPDVAALQRVIENSNNFESKQFFGTEFNNQSPEEYNLIVLSQIPSMVNQGFSKLDAILSSKVPLMFLIGQQSNLQLLNSMETGINIDGFKGSYNEALPAINPSFSLFLFSEQQKRLLENVPPLVTPFATFNIANSARVFSTQKIGPTQTDMPLILFNESPDRRTGIIAGEGIWKWRMLDYIQNSTHANFDDLIGKMFQYLTARTDRSRFRIEWNNFYAENENIQFAASLYNESYELITEPDVTMEITDESNKKFEYSFSRGDRNYTLKIGNFPPGIYTFEATADLQGEKLSRTGSFVVTEIKMEDINLVADHKLLNIIAHESGAKAYNLNETDRIAQDIRDREDVKSVTYSRRHYTDLIDFYPLMLLIFVLLGAEWFVRKYMGSY